MQVNHLVFGSCNYVFMFTYNLFCLKNYLVISAYVKHLAGSTSAEIQLAIITLRAPSQASVLVLLGKVLSLHSLVSDFLHLLFLLQQATYFLC